MVDELRTRITVEGDQAQRALKEVSDEEKKLADNTREAGDAAEGATEELGKMQGVTGFLGRGIGSLLDQVSGLVRGLVGVGGLVAAWRANRDEMQQNVALIRELADAQRDFLFLSSGNTDSELGAIKDAAEIVGGPGSRVELTRTFAQLKSQTANISEEERLAIFQQLVETSLTTSAKPTELVELFSKGARFVPDPQQLQNIIAQTIIESPESDPAVLARLLPEVLPAGVAAGITPAETAGALSFAAGEAGTASQGATGLRNILLALRGRGTPESREILERVGAGPEGNFFQQIDALSGAFGSGELGLADLEAIGGRENTALLSALLRNPQGLRDTVGRVVGAQGGDDITRGKLERTLDEFAGQNTELLTRQSEARIESLRLNDTDSARANLGRLLFEEQLRQNGELSTFRRASQLFGYDVFTGLGISPETSVGLIEPFFTDRISDPVTAGLNGRANLDVGSIGRASGGTSGGGGTVNHFHGQVINNGRDPRTADLDEGSPRR